jgi:hypothetical protein
VAEVFINYRTGDGDEAAELIATRLSERFGKEHIFKASHSIQPGEMYPQVLSDAARKSEVLLAVMGPDWGAAPELRDEADWVRKEILTAQSSGASVVPVLKGRKTDRLGRSDLPPELRWLADVNSLLLDVRESTADIKRIGDFLADLLPTLKAVDRTADEGAAPGARDNTNNSAEDVTGNVFQGRDFTGDIRNAYVSDAHGPTTIGDNNTQHNLSYYFGARVRTTLQARQQPIDELRRLQERFIRPPGFSGAEAIMEEHGTVILDGPPGSGRTAAAQMLLFGTWSGRGQLLELPQEQDRESGLRFNPDYVGPDDRVWVDLSDVGPLWDVSQRDLRALRARVNERRARLVVIMPYREELRHEFRPYLRRIEVPSQTQAFRHMLLAEDLLPPGEQVDLPKFLASTRSMADIRQFVDDVLDAREQVNGQGGIADWIAAAGEPTAPRERGVTEALARLQTPQRALLLCTAMLHGAHADVIDRRAAALLAGLTAESGRALEGLPLDQRLREIGAKPDVNRHVRFVAPGYEETVRSFFWRHFPELHNALASWVSITLDSTDLSDGDREELARGFTELCLEPRYQDLWTDLVEHLASGRRNLRKMWVAATILEHGLRSEKHSRTFRRQVYDWSLDKEISDVLAEVLVAACEAMADTNPAEALVRLHHIARRHHRRVGAHDALTDLARTTSWLLNLLLSRVTTRSLETAWEADAEIFLDISEVSAYADRPPTGQPLIEQDQVARQLAAGWTLAFTLPAEEWAPRAHDWLRRAAEDEPNQQVLVNVLVDGARQIPAVLPQLYRLAHRAPLRDAIAGLVLTKISEVQGVELP